MSEHYEKYLNKVGQFYLFTLYTSVLTSFF